MISLLFFNESLGFGGAECILTNIIENIDKSKFSLSVLCETDGEFHTDAVKKNARFKSIAKVARAGTIFGKAVNSLRMRLLMNLPEKKAHRLYIHSKYDVEIAFCEGFSTKFISGCGNKSTKKVAWLHTDVINHPWSEGVYGSSEIEKSCYEKYDAVVCVSQTMKDSFVKKYGMEEKTFVLYNPIDFDDIIKKSREPADVEYDGTFEFVMVGSLKKVKGYDRLLEVCKKLKSDGFGFRVRIMGSGSERENIVSLIGQYSLEENVILMDYQTNPYKYMKNADVFLCSSYAEGYSTAVSEAVVLGVPVVTTDCSGMREIFGENECGVICQNSGDGLYQAMKNVLEDRSVLDHFKAEEEKRAESFDIGERIKKIEEFFEKIAD